MPKSSTAFIRPLLGALALFVIAEDAFALRCGNRLVQEGMNEARVIELCGEPVFVQDLGYVLRPVILKRPAATGGAHAVRRVHTGYHEHLYVRELTFNFGPRRLMRIMRFEGGYLKSIETAGYGYLEKD